MPREEALELPSRLVMGRMGRGEGEGEVGEMGEAAVGAAGGAGVEEGWVGEDAARGARGVTTLECWGSIAQRRGRGDDEEEQ